MNEKSKVSKYAWVIVILGFLVAFSGVYPQYQLAPLAYLIIPDLNLTNSQFSSLFTAAMIPGILLSLVSGVLCDKVGPKRAVGIAAVIAAIGLIFRVYAGGYMSFMVCMVLSGVVATFFNANAAKFLGNWFGPEKLGMVLGIAMSGSTAAMAVGMGTTALFPSVKSAYIVAAVLAVIVTAGWWIFMKNKTAGTSEGAGDVPDLERPSVIQCLKVIIKSKSVWLTALCLLCVMGSSVSLSTFLPLALNTERGISAAASGVITSVIMFGNFAGTVTGPVIGAKIGRMKPYIFVCAVIAGLGTAFAWTAPQGILLIIAMFITGFATSSIIPTLISLPFLFTDVGPKYAGTAGGFVATIQLVGAVVIPTYIISPIGGTNYVLLFILAGISAALTALISLGLPEMFKKQV